MYASRRKFAKRPVRKYRRKVAKKTTRKPSKTFVRKVQSIIHKDVETKMAFVGTGDGLVYFNSGIDSGGDCQQLVPSIPNGGYDYQRIGDQIRGQKLSVSGYLQMVIQNNTSFSNKRIACRIMVITPKRYPTFADSVGYAAGWVGSLLKKGGNTVGFTGVPSDIYAPINTDVITCHYNKVVYMTQDNIINFGTTSYVAQDVSKTIKFFKFTIPLRNKLITYDNSVGSGQLPVNFNPFLIVGYCHLDAATPDTVTTQIGLQYNSCMYYEDA